MQQEPLPSLNAKAYLSALYQRYAPALFAYLHRHCGSLEDTEDLLLEVFLAALERPRFEALGLREQEAWLWCVARNKAVDYHRKRGRQGIPLDLVSEELYAQESTTPEVVLLRQEEHALLQAHIRRLPLPQQEVVRLRFAYGLRSAEIAAQLQKSEGAVRVMLSRALKMLRKIYENG
ncbi:sigma-70 family RNA polymerase sigma factor [Ktedonosporobacter rubrisoli]|uniref:Sigma-70 family RNA polymerase sigma factor n=1 Tax=Ktedonosporobacter rubrisoli TaxID=2509675 RepID=A0A4P6JLQ0_KTERU|nr:sigma-70 family RNA polymerase sigma factor [Ktedonosporobacter rubrisoli]QBD76159.1 sigma-70 family RNA polymerase sigma factor [Ktedonosporobacter rubrisoli]